jgi:hypothetical protein
MPSTRRANAKGRGAPRRPRAQAKGRRSWVRKVAATSEAMDLPRGIFKRSPAGIARGLKASVERSRRTKGRTKFQSAMSMLNLHVNRAGRSLPATDRRRLEKAKSELRRAFGRPASAGK